MKIKKVGAICNARGFYYLMNQHDEYGEAKYQWLGDGISAYPLVGLPFMDLENICAMFDITDKRKEKLTMRMMDAPLTMNWDDTDQAERQLADPKICVRYEGLDLLPLETSRGVAFVQEKYLAPLDNLEYMQLYERKNTSGGLYIVAKVGMVIQAVIMPMDLPNEEFMDALEKLTYQCRGTMKRRQFEPERDAIVPDQEPEQVMTTYKGSGPVTVNMKPEQGQEPQEVFVTGMTVEPMRSRSV